MNLTRIQLSLCLFSICWVNLTIHHASAAEAISKVGSEGKQPPNFIFVITDDISPDDLSIYGNRSIATPNLERLARRGLVFDNAYLTISSCSPSRCSIITGRYPHNTGAPELGNRLPATQKTFVQALRKAGYHTVLSGKNHMNEPEKLGFDVATNSKPAGSERWVEHLRKRPKEKPFFCWFASYDAHHAWQINDKAPQYIPEDVTVPPMLFDGPLTRQELANYYHEVSRTDHYVGELMRELRAQGIADQTYLIYCADNGRPLPRCKTYLYESGIQTPLVIVGPGVRPGRTDSLVSSIDFSATFLELAGVKCTPTIQGVSFVPVLRAPTKTVRDVAFAERNWHVYQNHARAVRTGRWLYIWNAWPNKPNVAGESSVPLFPAVRELWDMAEKGKLTTAQALLTKVPQPVEMLFDVEKDPHQLTNLANLREHNATLARMRDLLERWKSETGDSVPTNPTADRQPLHERRKMDNKLRGELPGGEKAQRINRPGPVRIEPS